MNKNDNKKFGKKAAEDLRRVPQLARRYAQNGAVPALLNFGVFLVLSGGILLSILVAKVGWVSDKMVIFAVSLVPSAISLAALVYFMVPRWGGRFVERLADRICGDHGAATLKPLRPIQGAWRYALAAGFVACVWGWVWLGSTGYVPRECKQPVSAIFIVPFFVMIWARSRPAIGLMFLLFPLLYALHALLIIVGVPILLTGRWEPLNLLIPTVGYGLLTAGLACIYRRMTLKRLRIAAREGMANGSANDVNSLKGQ